MDPFPDRDSRRSAVRLGDRSSVAG